jgi:hypothetical protein
MLLKIGSVIAIFFRIFIPVGTFPDVNETLLKKKRQVAACFFSKGFRAYTGKTTTIWKKRIRFNVFKS